MAHEEEEEGAAAPGPENNHFKYSLFRRPDKYKIGEDFTLFVKKLSLYFEAVELTDSKRKRLALLFNLNEDAFRLAESIELPETATAWKDWIELLKTLFERNQTITEKRYYFNKRMQNVGESVDSYAIALREFGSKCGFKGEEYSSRLVDQFILGLKDRATQSKLLQEPPNTLDEAVLTARRFEAANSTMETLGKSAEAFAQPNVFQVAASRPVVSAKVCHKCNGWGHLANQCPTPNLADGMLKNSSFYNNKVCYRCSKKGHIARNCRSNLSIPQHHGSFQGQQNFNQRSRGPPSCYKCGVEGHIATYCPSNNDNSVRPRTAEQAPNQPNSELAKPQAQATVKQDSNKIRLTAAAAANKKKVMMLEAKVNGIDSLCVVDTGASVSLLGHSQWESIKVNSEIVLSPADIVAEAANCSPIAILGKVVLPVKLDENLVISQEFYVSKEIGDEVILGLDFLLNSKAIIDTVHLQIKFPEDDFPLYIHDSSVVNPSIVTLIEDVVIPAEHEVVQRALIKNPSLEESILEPNIELAAKGILVARVIVRPNHQSVPIQIINPGKESVKLYQGTNLGSLEHVEIDEPALQENEDDLNVEHSFDLGHLKETEKQKLQQLLQKYNSLFAKGLNELGATSVVHHKIETGQATPIKQLPRRLPNVLKPVVEQQVNEMLDNGIVRPSKSPWASPIVLVRKKDGSWRFCVDFRKVNDVTIKDAYPLPQINDLIDSLAGQNYFSTLDLASGYWQVELDESSKEKTAFVIPGGNLLEFNRMPFGLANAVPTFQRLMARVLEGLQPKKCLVYLDDVLVVGKNLDEHCKNLEEVFEAIRQAGLRLKPTKCYFAKQEVNFLGFTISDKGLSPDPSKITAIKDFPRPRDLTELRRFLGMASYYRRFIAGFTEIVSPLNKLTQKNMKFVWDTQCEKAFNDLKEQLISSPVLAFPHENGEFVLYTDASDIGVGAVLAQKCEQGDEKVISFASKAFSSAEKNWTTTEKEAFAVVWALQYFHPYIYGTKVTIFTDHQALAWLRKIKQPNGKLARWILKLEQYDYTIVHKPGSMMQHADALSRAPVQGIKISYFSRDELEASQDLDSDILIVKDWLRKNQKPDKLQQDDSDCLRSFYRVFDTLCFDGNLLCKKWIDNTGVEKIQIVIPQFLTSKILKEVHESIGHFGVHKTFDMIQRRFYWPAFHKAVEDYCSSCELCAKNKIIPTPRRPMKPIEVKSQPFYMVGVDIIGPLKTTRQGNRYILSVIDYYTKYAEAEPLPNQEAATVVKVLEQIFSRHGMPTVLLTDQGRNFESHLFKSMCQLFGINKRRTTPYHPQSDGLCERFNGILKLLLRMKVNKDQDNWDILLPSALLAYRISKQESTGVSPFEMLYGREPQVSFDVTLANDHENNLNQDNADYLVGLKKRHEDLNSFVTSRIDKAQEKQKKNYDQKHRVSQSKTFQVGDVVLYKNFRASGLENKYYGPYRVIAVIENNCEIESMLDGKRRYVHCDSLKKFSPANGLYDEVSYSDNAFCSSSDSDEEEYYVPTNHQRRMVENNERPAVPHRYNLRRNRQPPERYGVVVSDY